MKNSSNPLASELRSLSEPWRDFPLLSDELCPRVTWAAWIIPPRLHYGKPPSSHTGHPSNLLYGVGGTCTYLRFSSYKWKSRRSSPVVFSRYAALLSVWVYQEFSTAISLVIPWDEMFLHWLGYLQLNWASDQVVLHPQSPTRLKISQERSGFQGSPGLHVFAHLFLNYSIEIKTAARPGGHVHFHVRLWSRSHHQVSLLSLGSIGVLSLRCYSIPISCGLLEFLFQLIAVGCGLLHLPGSFQLGFQQISFKSGFVPLKSSLIPVKSSFAPLKNILISFESSFIPFFLCLVHFSS